MAVVQISKIQVRRGQKNSPSGVPQLSSAEFAWAVDTQELYIGNGSVAEGAPYVGNTKIITEHDNLLEIASSYQFAPDYLTGSVPRSLQGKLDESVSILDFGDADRTGVQDCVAIFELAFQQLFNNTDPNFKKVLTVPNGEYYFATGLAIPSGVILKGETKNGVVLNIGSSNIRFVTSSGLEYTDFTSSNRPVDIEISNLTIKRTTGSVVLTGIADSVFKDVVFQGEYELTDTISTIDAELPAVLWENINNEGKKTTNVKFDGCSFIYNSVSVKCIQDSLTDSTEIRFEYCNFFVNYYGIYIDSVASQGHNWVISESKFEEIFYHAFISNNGRNTLIERAAFKKCGNGNSPTDYLYPIVYFNEKRGNILVDCTSDRHQLLVTTNTTRAAITDAYNSDKASFTNRNYSDISYADNFEQFAILSALNKSYTIRYFLTLGIHSRTGKLTISVSDDQTNVAITDEYQYSPSLVSDPGGSTMTNFEFNAELVSYDATVGDETISLQYRNPTTGASGTLTFDVTYGV